MYQRVGDVFSSTFCPAILQVRQLRGQGGDALHLPGPERQLPEGQQELPRAIQVIAVIASSCVLGFLKGCTKSEAELP